MADIGFFENRHINHPSKRHAAIGDTDQRAKNGLATDKCFGAINRVNDPAKARRITITCYAKFLALNGIIRKCGGDSIAKCGFGFLIGNCDRGLIGFLCRLRVLAKPIGNKRPAYLRQTGQKFHHIRRCQLGN